MQVNSRETQGLGAPGVSEHGHHGKTENRKYLKISLKEQLDLLVSSQL